MARIELKKPIVATQCACNGHQARHQIVVKGISATSQAELALCDSCFNELKEKIKAL